RKSCECMQEILLHALNEIVVSNSKRYSRLPIGVAMPANLRGRPVMIVAKPTTLIVYQSLFQHEQEVGNRLRCIGDASLFCHPGEGTKCSRLTNRVLPYNENNILCVIHDSGGAGTCGVAAGALHVLTRGGSAALLSNMIQDWLSCDHPALSGTRYSD